MQGASHYKIMNTLIKLHTIHREHIPNIALVVADDIRPEVLRDIKRQAKKLKTSGSHVILIATNYKGRRKYLNSIVSEPHQDNKIIVRTVRKLQFIGQAVAKHICQGKQINVHIGVFSKKNWLH